MRTEVTAIDLDARALTVLDRQQATSAPRPSTSSSRHRGRGRRAADPGAEASRAGRTVDAAERFRSALSRGGDGQHVVVIGGGYIGLEMAEELVQRNMPRR